MQLPRDLRGRDHSRVETAGFEQELVGAPVGFTGKRGVFRQAYSGSLIPGLHIEEPLSIDGVRICQVEGPIEGREVFVQQKPTPGKLTWLKAHHQRSFGAGTILTLADLPVSLETEMVGGLMTQWSNRCHAALGILAACLDERSTYKLLFENLFVFDRNGELEGVLDHVVGVRNFGPQRSLPQDSKNDLQGLTLSEELRTAFRWFLKGVKGGPSESGVIFFSTAIESLVNDPDAGKPYFDVKGIREAFAEVGGDEAGLPAHIGRCAGLRARIVHQGVENDEALRKVWYSLEWITRSLLRSRLSSECPWPLNPSEGVQSISAERTHDRHYLEGKEV